MAHKRDNLSEGDRKIVDSMSRKDLADVVGMPDEKDRENIVAIIKKYDKHFKGEIEAVYRDAKKNATDHRYVSKFESKEGRKRLSISLPTALMREIEEAYPAMFTSPKHFAWFERNFRGLVINEPQK